MFLIQVGHQTHSRIESAVEAGDTAGVIWSPADETPNGLREGIEATYMEGLAQAIDPQLYVAPLADANPKKLPDHGLFSVPMRPKDFAARNVVPLVERLLRFQAAFPLTHLVAPTVAIGSMADRWAEVAANLADASLDMWSREGDGRPLLISVAISESLLADPDNVDALLDELTSYDCDGFYLLLERDSSTDAAEAAVLFERALYIVYTLAQLNDYVVWVGYSGLCGFVYRAAGAEAMAGGWWQKQNWWSPNNWTAGSGGRQPRARIFLEGILGSLLIDAELRGVANQRTDGGLLEDVLQGAGPLAADFLTGGRPFDGNYDRGEMMSQLFAVLSALDARMTGDFQVDMRLVLHDIAAAEGLERRIIDSGVQLEPGVARTEISTWQTAALALGNRLGMTF